jgi:hypothetical protein
LRNETTNVAADIHTYMFPSQLPQNPPITLHFLHNVPFDI